jgi:hypothetical protein
MASKRHAATPIAAIAAARAQGCVELCAGIGRLSQAPAAAAVI